MYDIVCSHGVLDVAVWHAKTDIRFYPNLIGYVILDENRAVARLLDALQNKSDTHVVWISAYGNIKRSITLTYPQLIFDDGERVRLSEQGVRQLIDCLNEYDPVAADAWKIELREHKKQHKLALEKHVRVHNERIRQGKLPSRYLQSE